MDTIFGCKGYGMVDAPTMHKSEENRYTLISQ